MLFGCVGDEFKASHHGRGGTACRDGEGGYLCLFVRDILVVPGEKFGLFFPSLSIKNVPFAIRQTIPTRKKLSSSCVIVIAAR